MTLHEPILPTFIGVGAARSGTTSLYNWLSVHPQIYMSPIKETNYFSRLEIGISGPGDAEALNKPLERNSDGTFVERHAAVMTSWENYLALFTNSQGYIARGEVSPSYLYYPVAAMNIKQAIPYCKIVIILRNPIERAFSNYKALVKSGREGADFSQAWEKCEQRMNSGWEHFWDLKRLGLYYEQARRYLEIFGLDQVHIALFEDMLSGPKAFYEALCGFLGVDATLTPSFQNHNESRTGKISGFLAKHSDLRAVMRGIVPPSIWSSIREVDRHFFTRTLRMSLETRRHLLDYYRNDILELHRMLPELDVVRWIEYEEGILRGAR